MPGSLARSRRFAAAAACALSLLAAGCGEEPTAPRVEPILSGTWLGARYEGVALYQIARGTLHFPGGTGEPTPRASYTRVSASVAYDGPGTYPIRPARRGWSTSSAATGSRTGTRARRATPC